MLDNLPSKNAPNNYNQEIFKSEFHANFIHTCEALATITTIGDYIIISVISEPHINV